MKASTSRLDQRFVANRPPPESTVLEFLLTCHRADVTDADKARFAQKVEVGKDGCWYWIGSNAQGYGTFRFKGKPFRATRVMFYILTGEWPPEVCHTCDTPACVRHDHLFAGTHSTNMKDASVKGRVVNVLTSTTTRGERNVKSKLTEKDIRQIRQEYADGIGPTALATKYGIRRQMIQRIIRRQAWGHVQ